MRVLICVLLLQLSFSVYGAVVPEWLKKDLDENYLAVNFHFINKTDQPCTLTNKIHHISFWSEDYEPDPVIVDAGKKFNGYLRFYEGHTSLGFNPDDRFVITVGYDTFELHFVRDSCIPFPRLYRVIDGNQYIKAEKEPEICGYVAPGYVYRITQQYSFRGLYENDYYITMNDNDAPREPRIAAPTKKEKEYIEYARQVARAAQTAASEETAEK